MDTPINKDEWVVVMNKNAENSALAHLGIEVIQIEDDVIELHMPITDAVRQPFGYLHGGINMVLAETAASYHACWGVDLNKIVPFGIEINGSHLNSAKDGTVKAIGKVVRRSRSLIVHQVDMYHIESEKHLSTARVTNYYKKL